MFILLITYRGYEWKRADVIVSENVDALKRVRAVIEEKKKEKHCKLIDVPPSYQWRMYLDLWMDDWGSTKV